MSHSQPPTPAASHRGRPGDPQAPCADGDPCADLSALRCAVARDPDDLRARQDLASRLLDRRELDQAEVQARAAVRLGPLDARSHHLLAMVLTEAGRPHPGEFHYRRAMALTQQPDAALLANLAWNLKSQGRLAQARALYRESTALDPGIPQAWLGWARLEAADRDLAAAGRMLDRAQALAPRDAGVLAERAALLARARASRRPWRYSGSYRPMGAN